MADKVKLPKEVAKAIDGLRKCGYGAYPIICMVHENRDDPGVRILRDYAVSQHEDLLRALVNGYEVEDEPLTVTITPDQQEEIKNYILGLKREYARKEECGYSSVPVLLHQVEAAIAILRIANIKIKGVNT